MKRRGKRSARYAAYRRLVAKLTDEHHPPRVGTTRQHHVPITRAFDWGIPAELVGSPENVSYMPLQENLQQGTQLDEKGKANMIRWGFGHRLRK